MPNSPSAYSEESFMGTPEATERGPKASSERTERIAAFWKQEVYIPYHLPPLLVQQLSFENLHFRDANKPNTPDLLLGHDANTTTSDREPSETAVATAQVGILTSFAGIYAGRVIVVGYDMKNQGELLRLKVSITYNESQRIIDEEEKQGIGVFDALVCTDNSGYADHTTPITRGMTAQTDIAGLARLVNLPEGARLGPQTPFGFARKTPHDYAVAMGFTAERTETTVSLALRDAFRVEVPRFLSH